MSLHDAGQLGVLSLWAAFGLGLTGGFGHCLAMCGPFLAGASLGLGATQPDSRAALGFQLSYHVGRLATYATIGIVLGLLGASGSLLTLEGPFSPLALSRYLKLLAGLATVALGLWLLTSWVLRRTASIPEPTRLITGSSRFSKAVGALMRRGGAYGLPAGLLMGLLPCGPLLPVELAALAAGGPLDGSLVMLAFGIGTVPALATFGAASGLVGVKARGTLLPVVGLFVLALGGLTVMRGLGSLAL